MNGSILHLTLRELQIMYTLPRLWIVFALVVVLFTVTGPFGTYDRLPFAARLGYWLANHAMSWASALFCVNFFNFALKSRVGHSLPRMMIGAAVAALPIGAVVAALNSTVMQAPLSGGRYLESISTALPVSLVLCLIVWLTMNSTEQAAPESVAMTTHLEPVAIGDPAIFRDKTIQTNPPLMAFPKPALLDRLPSDKRGAIIRLEVQDHYVLVVTTRGRELVLIRFSDAMREVGPAQGMQVHRSHWVARDGIAEILRESGKNGRTTIRTVDNAEIPVSRGNAPMIRTLVL